MASIRRGFWRVGAIASTLSIFAACSGGGGGGGGSGPGPSKLFVVDEVNAVVGSMANSNPAPGTTVALDRAISGPNTQLPPGISFTNPGPLDGLRSLALDAQRDHLYVSISNDIFNNPRLFFSKVLVFHNAGTATGNVAPSRTIALAPDQKYVQLDPGRDVLYISTRAGEIRVVHGASTANTSVSSPSTETLTLGAVGTIAGLALDPAKDVLYIALSSSSVGTIVGVSGKTTGPVTLDAQWNVTASPASITVDPARDRLFVLVSDLQGSILAYDGASTRTTAAPGSVSRTFTVGSGFAFAPAIFLESSSDRLYAVDQNKIFIVSAAGSANGPTPATLAQLPTMNTGLTAVVARP